MTAHKPPRIKKSEPGRCLCPKESFTIIVPMAVEYGYGYGRPRSNATIDPESPFEGCPLWRLRGAR